MAAPQRCEIRAAGDRQLSHAPEPAGISAQASGPDRRPPSGLSRRGPRSPLVREAAHHAAAGQRVSQIPGGPRSQPARGDPALVVAMVAVARSILFNLLYGIWTA